MWLSGNMKGWKKVSESRLKRGRSIDIHFTSPHSPHQNPLKNRTSKQGPHPQILFKVGFLTSELRLSFTSASIFLRGPANQSTTPTMAGMIHPDMIRSAKDTEIRFQNAMKRVDAFLEKVYKSNVFKKFWALTRAGRGELDEQTIADAIEENHKRLDKEPDEKRAKK